MSNKYKPDLPWTAMDNGLVSFEIVDCNYETVATMDAIGDEDRARHIVRAVNYHHRLRGMVRRLSDECELHPAPYEMIDEARDLLAELDNMENGS